MSIHEKHIFQKTETEDDFWPHCDGLGIVVGTAIRKIDSNVYSGIHILAC